jgi:predicted ATPase
MIHSSPNGLGKSTLLETVGDQIRGDIQTGCKLEEIASPTPMSNLGKSFIYARRDREYSIDYGAGHNRFGYNFHRRSNRDLAS